MLKKKKVLLLGKEYSILDFSDGEDFLLEFLIREIKKLTIQKDRVVGKKYNESRVHNSVVNSI